MNRLDRGLAILLLLRKGNTLSAADLAAHFEVSVRTIYRDIEMLSEVGVPIYAEMGREGGFRLLEGYFLPPVMFSKGEATSLLLGLALLRRLRVTPFPGESTTAEHKLLAALPDPLRNVLRQLPQLIGFEDLPPDTFHWGANDAPIPTSAASAEGRNKEEMVVGLFLRCVIENKTIKMAYRSPYHHQDSHYHLVPCGLLWDRDWWYLSGHRIDQPEKLRLWRADRVLQIDAGPSSQAAASSFDVNQLLGRQWLQTAMTEWRNEAPVKIRLTRQQAERLQQDWYYRCAFFEEMPEGGVMMTFGEDNPHFVLDLVRWLGPGAELLEPIAWRQLLYAELSAMLALYVQP